MTVLFRAPVNLVTENERRYFESYLRYLAGWREEPIIGSKGLNVRPDRAELIQDYANVLARRISNISSETELVYCTRCQKTHAVRPNEVPCAPGAWLSPEPVR